MIAQVVLLAIFLGVLSYAQFGYVYRSERVKGVVVYLALMSLILGVGSAVILGIHVPSPATPWEMAFSKLGKFLLQKQK